MILVDVPGTGLVPRLRGKVRLSLGVTRALGVSPAFAGRDNLFSIHFPPPTFGHTKNTPTVSGNGEQVVQGHPTADPSGKPQCNAKGGSAFHKTTTEKNPRKRAAPPGLWPMGWGRLITTVCSPAQAGEVSRSTDQPRRVTLLSVQVGCFLQAGRRRRQLEAPNRCRSTPSRPRTHL